ncbi:MAG: BNR repeat-containing protein [Planctomycetota bacterium]|nr:BNR repeat-containing protein [Planctomycetota bacterium]
MHRLHLALALCLATAPFAHAATVEAMKVPDGGIQPQVAVDAQGGVHLLYFKGEPGAGDLYYAKSTDGGKAWSKGLKVNSGAGSAIATGSVRGAHLALGRNGRPHAAWMGSNKAEPKGAGGATPMLYARLDEAGAAFEPQRNVMQVTSGLDGGGTVAADPNGNVHVIWHGIAPGLKGEENRQVFVARSSDDGKTFAREAPAFNQPTGACACCGMEAFADAKGRVFVLFRAAMQKVNRDMFLLIANAPGAAFQGSDIAPWKAQMCVMSTASFSEAAGNVLAGWEAEGQVYLGRIDAATLRLNQPLPAPGPAGKRKHPKVAGNASGESILAWTEGTGWQKGGAAAWQVFDKDGKPTEQKGRADGVPVWGLVAAFARADGNFVVLY